MCGDAEGVTTFQLDIKCNGLTFPTLERALQQVRGGWCVYINAYVPVCVCFDSRLVHPGQNSHDCPTPYQHVHTPQAKAGRLHILNIMNEACPAPRQEMRPNVPRISTTKINPQFIGKLIGKWSVCFALCVSLCLVCLVALVGGRAEMGGVATMC